MSHDDVKLVEAARAGQSEAFDRLVERYQRQAVAVAGRLLHNLDDALEVAQEGFIRAYQALEQLNDPQRFGSWLMRIVANQALNYRRSHRRDPKVSLERSWMSEDGSESGGPLSLLAGKEPSAPQQYAAQELAEAMQQAIEELPENLRDPLVLFTVEKLPQKEIAEMLNCSLQTVKWSVFEARRRLRIRLEKWL
ncbi:MAG: sigma-70 family RNA polymerase sigma factor [Sedimentisphaerales bacterium]|nr:sigma-70 family RNA polymerase sigma factor [Sedimentisphaerales bacterium]